MLVSLERDMYVLMAELATAPENRDKLTPGQSSVSQVMVDRLEPLIDDLTRGSSSPRSSCSPVRPGSLRTSTSAAPSCGAERAALSAAGTLLVVPYLNRLSDLLWTWPVGKRARRSPKST
jgi:cob(I)alamin adenosyltransferase